jgi:membrane-bound lytic murein transglycosylase A
VPPLSDLFVPGSFETLQGWHADDHSAAFDAFRRSATASLIAPPRMGDLGVDAAALSHAWEEAAAGGPLAADAARAFFERHFRPAQLRVEGFVTGYYEPEHDASPVRTESHTVPLLARPADLVEIDAGAHPPGMDPSMMFGRTSPAGIVPYHDRGEIDRGALAGRGLEIAWLADKVDAFFIHVQGSARLRMTDGSTRRVGYAAKSGHPFTGIGRELAGLGEIPLEKVTMQSIRAWLAAHPHRVDEILWRNRSYIFFRDMPPTDATLGPVGAAGVQLTPERSMAVDRLLHTYGTPIHVEAERLTAFDGRPFRRLMIAQDTGSAITGPARGDLFAGSGNAAGEIAGVVRSAATFHVLLPLALLAGSSS